MNEAPKVPAHRAFCANHEAGLKCPKCGEESVYVREHEKYMDGYEYEAFCARCDIALEVYAYVDVNFGQPELVG